MVRANEAITAEERVQLMSLNKVLESIHHSRDQAMAHVGRSAGENQEVVVESASIAMLEEALKHLGVAFEPVTTALQHVPSAPYQPPTAPLEVEVAEGEHTALRIPAEEVTKLCNLLERYQAETRGQAEEASAFRR